MFIHSEGRRKLWVTSGLRIITFLFVCVPAWCFFGFLLLSNLICLFCSCLQTLFVKSIRKAFVYKIVSDQNMPFQLHRSLLPKSRKNRIDHANRSKFTLFLGKTMLISVRGTRSGQRSSSWDNVVSWGCCNHGYYLNATRFGKSRHLNKLMWYELLYYGI